MHEPASALESAATALPPASLNTASSATARAAALGEVVLMSGFPTQLALGLLLLAAGLNLREPDGHLSMTYLVTLWVLDAAVLLGLLVALVRRRGDRVGALLFGTRAWPREVGLGAALVPVAFAIVVGAMLAVRSLWPGLHNVAVNPFQDLIRTPLDALLLATMAVVSGGIKEECQRAFVLQRFEQHLGGAWVGLVVFSLAFGAGHFVQGWDAGVVTTLLGAFWGVVFLKRRSIVASVVSHAGFNVAQILQFVVFGS